MCYSCCKAREIKESLGFESDHVDREYNELIVYTK
jgi:hypothetical protein